MQCAKATALEVHGCFVIGLPGETEKSAQETIDFALNLGLTTAQFSGAVPFPGTKFYELCQENNWLKVLDWPDWLSDGEQSGVVECPNLSRERINYYVDLGLKKFYLWSTYMLNFILKNRSWSDFYRKLRGAGNFISYLSTKWTNL